MDVAEYLRNRGVSYKPAGSKNVHTTCFFCDERPEARGRLYINVDPDAEVPGLFMCHRCGERGSLASLKKHFGDKPADDDLDQHTRHEILNTAAQYYHSQLSHYVEVLQYLKGPERGLTAETLTAHQIGYAPMNITHEIENDTTTTTWPTRLYCHLRDEGYTDKDILATGLCHERNGHRVDALGGMVTIPYQLAGNVVAIRGRTWPQTSADFAQWLGDPYEPHKSKYKTCSGTSARLFNADVCWDSDEVYITEGEFDALVLGQNGFRAVGVPGAEAWQQNWDDYLTNMKRVWLLYDRDAAGEKGARKLTERIGSKVRRVHLSPEGTKCDPTMYFAQHTLGEFTTILAEARKGGMLVTVGEAIDEFAAIQHEPGIRFGWELLDIMIAPGLQAGQVMVLLAKTNTGKGHPLETRVPTPDGMRRWGDLEVGDFVFGSDGRPTKVVAVHDRGHLPTYRVRFSDGSDVLADGDHIWTVAYRSGRDRAWVPKDLTTAELAEQDLRRGSEYRYTIPMCAPVERPEVLLPVEPYTLGALIANGSLCGTSAILTTPDHDVVERIRTHHDIVCHARPPGACPSYGIRGVIGLIKRFGLNVKSREKFIPEQYLNGSIDQRLALLQGLFDGDGSANSRGRRAIRYSTTSRRLADDVTRLVASLGGTATQNWIDRGRYWECAMNVMLPTGIVAFSSQRKAQGASGSVYQTVPRRAIVAVEPVGDCVIRCITVDAADSLYLIGDQHIVTHNSILLLNLLHRIRMVTGQQNAKILLVSLEQTRGEWWDRARRIHRFYNIAGTEAEAEEWWQDNILLVDQNRLTEPQLRQILEDYAYQMGAMPDLMGVDYLGYWARSFRGESYQRTSDAIMAMKSVAKEHRIPVIMPHQVSRIGRDGEEFGGDAGRDSGVVEETADFVFTMWKPDNTLGRVPEESNGIIHMRIAKSRHGGRGQLLSMQEAPISLAYVPEGDPLCARARKEIEWKREHRSTWPEAVFRHRTGIEGRLRPEDFAEPPARAVPLDETGEWF